jgi:hypothetical protein
MMFLPDFEGGIGLAAQLRPPAGHIFLERAAANLAEAVALTNSLNANHNRHKKKAEMLKTEMLKFKVKS